MQGLPGADLLVLCDAEADLAHVAERGPVERTGHATAGELHHQAERPAYGQVCPVPGTEDAHPAVHGKLVPNRAVDDDQLPGWLGGDGLAVQVEPAIECCFRGGNYDR